MVAPEPTLEGRVRIRLAVLGDLIGVGTIEREFEEHTVGVFNVDGAAIAVLEHKGVGLHIARRLDALLDLLLSHFVDLERDVMKGRLDNRWAKRPLVVLVGELEERQCAAIRKTKEAVTIRAHLSEQLVGFAPGSQQEEAQSPPRRTPEFSPYPWLYRLYDEDGSGAFELLPYLHSSSLNTPNEILPRTNRRAAGDRAKRADRRSFSSRIVGQSLWS
jgi:hypothetical protein